MSVLKSKKSFVYRTMIIRRLCKQANAPDAIESKINECLELLERKYLNGETLTFRDLLYSDEERLKTSFPSSESQLIDLAERFNLPLTLYSAIQGFTCLFPKNVTTDFETYKIGRWSKIQLFRVLIKSPYLQSTNALTFLNNMKQPKNTYYRLLHNVEITQVGTMKAYQWLTTCQNRKGSIFEIDYLMESILLTGSYYELITIPSLFQYFTFTLFVLKNIVQKVFKHKEWNDITRVSMITSLFDYILRKTTSEEQFVTILKEFLITIISTRVVCKKEKDVIIPLFESINTKFYPFINKDPTIFSGLYILAKTPFFLHLWLFQQYQFPLQDPIDIIVSNINLSYAREYFLHFESNDDDNDFDIIDYIETNRYRITTKIVESYITAQHISLDDLKWFIEYFQLHSIIKNINTFQTMCILYATSVVNDEYSSADRWKNVEKRYKWLLKNNAYQPTKLSTLFLTKQMDHCRQDVPPNILSKLLRLGEFKIDQEQINDIATTYMEDGKINYDFLILIFSFCSEQNIIVQFPDSICFSTMIDNNMLYSFIPFLLTLHVRKLNPTETLSFIDNGYLLYINMNYDLIKKILDPDITHEYIIKSNLINQQYHLSTFFHIWPTFIPKTTINS